MCYFFSLNRDNMSDRTRTRKIAPKAGNDYKQAELVAAAKDGIVKDVGLPTEMFPKSEYFSDSASFIPCVDDNE